MSRFSACKAPLFATVALVGLSLGAAQARPTALSQPWGNTPDGKPVRIVTLKNDHNVTVRVITYGGIIQSVETPDRNGHPQDIVLGFGDLKGYTVDSAKGGLFFGAIIGRYANRLAGGSFPVDGKIYHTDITAAPNALHGGKKGFDKNVWTLEKTGVSASGSYVTLKLVSPNGDQGFPGTLTTHVTYTLGNDNALSLHYVATTDAPTVLNLTNHSYWNLNGEGSGSIEPEILQINADSYTPTDSTSIPTGQLAPVAGTPLDFSKPTEVGARLRSNDIQMMYARGYDMNWVVNGAYGQAPRLAGKVYDPRSGRSMEVLTNQPGLQVYTSNSLDGGYAGISGHAYRQTDAIAFEAEHYPDSPNHPSFPTTELKPGQTFDYTTTFKFSNQ
ncbi:MULTISPECIES: aldose epimerase family protein [Gluconobacter]|uniref:Aldose 1-epimerase n=1 Tax=Gluconobacter cerinus TaxID=38307 RepID=A0AAV5NF49_9PROT|nr:MULTISPECIES: aldose epimerase family protein [Gluconobacter]MBM3097255.1 galactose mutarotase [Gluconobacter cerinus]MBS0982457.1 galactose mutarotase [Gluconobacter cerinus]MBS1033109.1 galactose mutarotase [Gluconobacter cerinus]MBS1068161.1 galactose mutarotase [Gluconobacter cerinus]GLQ63086.1 aldose 1-epimerase [Gluconobacter cerinus]